MKWGPFGTVIDTTDLEQVYRAYITSHRHDFLIAEGSLLNIDVCLVKHYILVYNPKDVEAFLRIRTSWFVLLQDEKHVLLHSEDLDLR